MVGAETLPRRIRGLPAIRLSLGVVVSASEAGLEVAPGAACGQSASVVWLAAGGQGDCWAERLETLATVTAATRSRQWRKMAASRLEFAAMILASLRLQLVGRELASINDLDDVVGAPATVGGRYGCLGSTEADFEFNDVAAASKAAARPPHSI